MEGYSFACRKEGPHLLGNPPFRVGQASKKQRPAEKHSVAHLKEDLASLFHSHYRFPALFVSFLSFLLWMQFRVIPISDILFTVFHFSAC